MLSVRQLVTLFSTLVLLLPTSLADESDDFDITEAELETLISQDTLVTRSGRSFGIFSVSCKDAEGACNNACYHITCKRSGALDGRKIVYIGPGNTGESTRNRIESGCQTSDGSVCGNFPFSQRFLEDQSRARDMDCDEWPPAVSQQPFFSNKRWQNSLRCIPSDEARRLGVRIGDFINNRGGPYPGRPNGRMSRDDYFYIRFDLRGADRKKLQYCLVHDNSGCASDGYGIEMSKKSLTNRAGKISSPYVRNGNDNRYRIEGSVYKDLFQCSVEMTRRGDRDFENIKLLDANNRDVTKTRYCNIQAPRGSCTLRGLPNNLSIFKSGNLGTKIGFRYADSGNINYFQWDSESTGDGRGPATDDGQPSRFCKLTRLGNREQIQCWFPCYKRADGQ